MPAGTVQTIIECLASGVPVTGFPCPNGTGPVAVQAYVIDPGSAGYIDGLTEPFDVATAGSFFFAAFIFTMALYIGTSFYGGIIEMVRRYM